LGAAPLITDGDVVLAESGAIGVACSAAARASRQVDYLGGSALTDIMTVFVLTTTRHFYPTDLAPYPRILSYLRRIGERHAYRIAMQKGDPEMIPLLARRSGGRPLPAAPESTAR
jgi:glutathione S-transferase